MNKTAMKNFATWARNKLIADITYKAGLMGVTDKGISEPLPQSTGDMQFFKIGTSTPYSITGKEIEQRRRLVSIIHDKARDSEYTMAFNAVVEEVAYTWFNRLIAVRFMEVNDYLPSRVRVLSSESKGKAEPDLVTTPFDAGLDFNSKEKELIAKLKLDNKLDDLFRILFIKQCNVLNTILPELFESTSDYSELLLGISYTDKDGIVSHLVNNIEEDDFRDQVQIIGWLYQYYNTEPKDETFALLKKNVKITKERIPTATQLFTPDWIVRYMVENSLGRLWLEREQANSGLMNEYLNGSYFGWRYYLEEAEQEESVKNQLNAIRNERKNIKLEDIKVIDPCMGSGHILVYAFDVLMQIYESQGYSKRDAARSILRNNLFGLDIDKRAYQLTCFSLFMKARSYDRRFFSVYGDGGRNAPLHVEYFEETNSISPQEIENIIRLSKEIANDGMDKPMDNEDIETLKYLYGTFLDARDYGSILKIENRDYRKLAERLMDLGTSFYQVTIDTMNVNETIEILLHCISISEILTQSYDVVVTNPPYMSSSGMSAGLAEYVKKKYPDSKSDLFAAFIEKGNAMVKMLGYNCMVTMQSWMFLSSYGKLREKLLTTKTITNLMHMENMVMGIAFGTAVTIFQNVYIPRYKGTYNLVTIKDILDENPSTFPVAGNRFAQVSGENFSKIPGMPLAYWASNAVYSVFEQAERLDGYSTVKHGLSTGKNEVFVRNWFEVSFSDVDITLTDRTQIQEISKRYVPYNKGGEYRKWYGNIDYVLWYDLLGQHTMQTFSGHRHDGKDFYFHEGITWSFISSSNFGVRYTPTGFAFDVAGSSLFPNHDIIYYLCGFLCSKLSQYFLKMQNPTLNFQVGNIASLPILVDVREKSAIEDLVMLSIKATRNDWDSFEISWGLKKHPLIHCAYKFGLESVPVETHIATSYKEWKRFTEAQFLQLKTNEEELNRIFIEIYGLQDELSPNVDEKDVTVARIYDGKGDIPESMKGNGYVLIKSDVVKSFISYAVGCMFGRYSLDVEGLAYAGGDWVSDKYLRFIPDKDNIIPITDEEYYEDDIVGRFIEFLKVVYGDQTLEENLEFIANALGNKGNSSREIIRNYFIKDFFKDHCKTYRKRPIYWLFDSGKQNGFKALVYMHRYDENTIGNLRIDYLHRIQRVYESEIARMQDTIDNSTNGREIAAAEKRKDKLTKQLKETKEYDAKIAHLALARIVIDLDDGVKVNYDKVQTDTEGKKLDVLAKI